jgi:integrase
MSEDAEIVSSDVEESAALAINELLPVKSRKKYDKAYQQFEDWCREKRVRDITEEVLLAYFEQKSRKLKGSTLWSLFSRSTIQLKKNIEIKKYASLITFIKRKSSGQVSKKTNIFTKQEIEKFLREAVNGTYLMMKVKVTFM